MRFLDRLLFLFNLQRIPEATTDAPPETGHGVWLAPEISQLDLSILHLEAQIEGERNALGTNQHDARVQGYQLGIDKALALVREKKPTIHHNMVVGG